MGDTRRIVWLLALGGLVGGCKFDAGGLPGNDAGDDPIADAAPEPVDPVDARDPIDPDPVDASGGGRADAAAPDAAVAEDGVVVGLRVRTPPVLDGDDDDFLAAG